MGEAFKSKREEEGNWRERDEQGGSDCQIKEEVKEEAQRVG